MKNSYRNCPVLAVLALVVPLFWLTDVRIDCKSRSWISDGLHIQSFEKLNDEVHWQLAPGTH